MKRKRLDEINEGEILARPLMTWDYQVIMPAGAALRKEYIDRISDLGILEVYVEDEKTEQNQYSILNNNIKNTVNKKVRDILERHTYQNNEELAELNSAADNIITTILEDDRVVEKIFDIKERSTDIYEHSINVCALAILTALKLKVEKDKIHDIGVGCLLHDIGLRYITVDFLGKDMESLGRKEQTELKKHPVLGYSSLKDENWISDLSKYIILYHHERADGSGYPLHLREIPLECRIVAVCDAFDEMICGITYRQIKTYEAIEYFKNYKGVKFDGRVVNTLLEFTAVYPVGSKVLTNEGETGVVIAQNKSFQDRPIIRITKDKDGNAVPEEKIIDLVQIHHVFIDEVLD